MDVPLSVSGEQVREALSAAGIPVAFLVRAVFEPHVITVTYQRRAADGFVVAGDASILTETFQIREEW
ncbi:hypothetical protein [Cellulomonas sp. RIT-PI-Y]|uniref:hypothetical protein n=1 Tax=Cellulomonas sp. RIT-PI-Y TaxID=3035297 RepID=UPI0021D8B2AD|nr:hypothetical protein [Cellulomonas sp. RIT-PI-Y]